MNYTDTIKNIITFAPPYLSDIKPSVWAEQNRIMSSDVSPFPGKFSYDNSPYAREIIDTLSPDHPARCVAIMKGAQIGLSTGLIENGIGYIISQQPGNILLAARDESLVKKMVETKIDQMIDSCGLRDLIRPNVIRKRNQRTGDTSLSKEFAGGNLSAFSIQTPGKMRQISCQYGFLDDFEAAPVDKSAGSADKLFETRFKAYYSKMKLYYISTPELDENSNIKPLYLRGDQRRYYVECPCCKERITLEWQVMVEGEKAGITWKLDNHGNVLDTSVGYICQLCSGYFKENVKKEMILNGIWQPTAEPKEKDFYSYHISTLYAPPGMAPWYSNVVDYVRACPPNGDVDKEAYKTFVNTVLGETYSDKRKKTDAKGILLNTRDYDIGLIPENKSLEDGNGPIVMITLAADCNGKEEDGRIDWELLAHSASGASYSIDHGSIGTFVPREKIVDENRAQLSYDLYVENSIWPDFKTLINAELPTDTGRKMTVTFTGIDSGHFTKKIYAFIDSCKDSLIIALKGETIHNQTKENVDTKGFKVGKENGNLYILEVNKLKDDLADLMRLKWANGENQPPGFMNFPEPKEGKYSFTNYFSHFEAEERVAKRSSTVSYYTWEKRNSAVQNHFWDVRIYGNAVRDIAAYLLCKEMKIYPSFQNYVSCLDLK